MAPSGSESLWAWSGSLVKRMCRITKTHLRVPGISAQSQPWPAVFTFSSRGLGCLKQIPFVQSWSTRLAGVAPILRAMMKWYKIPIKILPKMPFAARAAHSFSQVDHSEMVPNGFKWLQMAPNSSNRFQRTPNDSISLQIAPNNSKWLQMASNGSKWLQMGKMASNG